MIREVEEAISESLRKGLSELVPPENIIIGEPDQKTANSLSLINTGFTVEDLGIGGSGGVKKEEIVEKFDSDGKKKDFNLSKKPLRPLTSVESPVGTEKKEPDDYTVNYEVGTISFRAPPEKRKDGVQVKFYSSREVGEVRNLKFILNYSIAVKADDLLERDRITLEAIKVLFRERQALIKRGIEEIKLIKGYSAQDMAGQARNTRIIEYMVETTIKIEMPAPPIERIEIGKMQK